MPSALSIIGALTLGLVGAGAMYGWDRHEPIGFTVPIPLWHPRVGLPDSLLTQRDRAVQATRIAEEGTKACRATLASESSANAREAALGAAVLADTQKKLDLDVARVADLHRRASILHNYVPAGPDLCARWEDADRIVLMMLRGD